MGRPQDEFCWDNVEKLPEGRWKCKHCKEEFSGAASRIRNHLSGQGNDIRSCEVVPSHIREDALKRTPVKRVRPVGENNDPVNDIEPLQVCSSTSCFNDGNVAEKEVQSTIPAVAMPIVNNSLEGAAPIQVPSTSWFINNIHAAERRKISNLNVVDMSVVGRNDLVTGSPFEVSPSAEDIVDALVKSLMSRNVPIDFIHDSHFMTFLTNVAQYGLPWSLVQEKSSIIQKSLWNVQHEVTLYMQMVKDSWKTTGSTLMFYDFDQGKDSLTLGFYCPKGFIFMEVDQPVSYYSFKKALKDHVLKLSMDDVIKCVSHHSSHVLKLSMDDVIKCVSHHSSHVLKCLYQARSVTDDFGSTLIENLVEECEHTARESCVRHRIHEKFCKEICEKSKWVQNLIKKSDQIYQCIVSSNLYAEYYKRLMQGSFEDFVDGKHATSLARLRSVMALEQDLRCWLSNLPEYQRFNLENETGISSIINNFEFWYDGNELLEVITPFLKIPQILDTLIPSGGYLYMLIDKAKCVLKCYYDRRSMKYLAIWYSFERWLADNVVDAEFDPLQNTAAYLIPVCVLSTEVQWDLEETDFVTLDLKRFCEGRIEEEALDAEIKDYNIRSSNPFTSIPVYECRVNHPVKLWYKHGGRFPILQKCAIKILSQPVSCLSTQVKKHMSQLQGTDNYILRLNYWKKKL